MSLPPSSSSFSPSSAGLGGIIRAAKDDSSRIDAELGAAFRDLNALMRHAQDLVTLAERVSDGLARRSASLDAGHSQNDNREVEAKAKLASLSDSLGVSLISNPVERSDSRSTSAFHKELARELSMWFAQLKDQAAMLALTDVYSMYNRARGVALISPEECYRACSVIHEMDQHRDPLRMMELEGNGVRVLCRTSSVQPSSIDPRILALIGSSSSFVHRGLTALEMSSQLGLNLRLVEARCRALEERGELCRDEWMSTSCRFLSNRFHHFLSCT